MANEVQKRAFVPFYGKDLEALKTLCSNTSSAVLLLNMQVSPEYIGIVESTTQRKLVNHTVERNLIRQMLVIVEDL